MGTVLEKEAQKAVAVAICGVCREKGVEATQGRIAKVVELANFHKFARRTAYLNSSAKLREVSR